MLEPELIRLQTSGFNGAMIQPHPASPLAAWLQVTMSECASARMLPDCARAMPWH